MAAAAAAADNAATAAAADAAAAAALDALSLRAPSRRPVLAWDALNYLRCFMDAPLARRDPWRAVRAMEARVAEFTAAAVRGGYTLVAVVDAGTGTDEASAKWRSRRVRELTSEDRGVVLGADVLLTDALRECGVPVVRPLNADADDVIAALAASTPGGGVLSGDGDMFRYEPRDFVVHDGWRLEPAGGLLTLAPTPAAPSRAAKAEQERRARPVEPELAAAALAELGDAARAASAIRDKYQARRAPSRPAVMTSFLTFAVTAAAAAPVTALAASLASPAAAAPVTAAPLTAHYASSGPTTICRPSQPPTAAPAAARSAKGGRIIRGTSSSSDRRRGSLHELARPLRAAVYGRLGEDAGAIEMLARWRDGRAVWEEEAVAADPRLDALLDDVAAAAAWLDERDGPDGGDGAGMGDAPAPWPQEQRAWRAAERRFARRVLAAELCAAAAAGQGSLLALMRAFPEYGSAQPSAAECRAPREERFESRSREQRAAEPDVHRDTCRDCGAAFGLKAYEVEGYRQRGHELPRRCKPCRDKRKATGRR